MHGGASTGPITLEGLNRVRAARNVSGRFSVEGRAMAAWRRQYFAGAYRSSAALGAGTIGSRDGQTVLREHVAREEAEGIAPAVVEAKRQAVRAVIAERNMRRLREGLRLEQYVMH